MIDLTDRILKFGNKKRKRTPHRYSAKEIWAMTTTNRYGELYLTPEQWLNGEEKDYQSCLNVWEGSWKHMAIQMLFPDYEQEIKTEYKYKHLTIVGVADFLIDDVIDLKTSKKIKETAPPWDKNQIKLYLTMFDKKIGRLWQPIIKNNKYYLNEFGVIKRDDTWFLKQMEKVMEFDKSVEEINKELEEAKEEPEYEEPNYSTEYLKQVEKHLIDSKPDGKIKIKIMEVASIPPFLVRSSWSSRGELKWTAHAFETKEEAEKFKREVEKIDQPEYDAEIPAERQYEEKCNQLNK